MSLDEDLHPLDIQLTPRYLSKKPYMAPKIIPIFEVDISNHMSGDADGDAALAQS